MILINLLPHRELRRQERRRAFFTATGLAALMGAGCFVLWYAVVQQQTAAQVDRNQFLSSEIKQLDSQIAEIASLREEIEALNARQRAVEDLQTDRNVPVYLLNELARQTPQGVYLTSIKQTGNTVNITGLSQTNERVSELLRNTAYNSPWLERPDLVEIKTATARDLQRRLFEFSMRVDIKRPQPPADKASDAKPGRKAAAKG
ncbi:MAG: PilN domain-containing protein [Proteobacteria bacterium]|nr:PilN domain-containing protein [Pseudomonadota bacterium]